MFSFATRTEVLNSSNDGQGFLVGNEISAGVLTQALDNPQIPLSSSSIGIDERRLSDDSQQPSLLSRLQRCKVNRKIAGIFTLLNNDNNDNVPFDLQANNDDNTNDDNTNDDGDDVFSVKSSKQTIEITSPVQILNNVKSLARQTYKKKRIRAIGRVPEDDRRTEVYEILCISYNSDNLHS